MISVIIPARNERLLARTVEEIYQNFTGDFEVIICIDGWTEHALPHTDEYKNLSYIGTAEPLGIRSSLNRLADASSGDYILKFDAHCLPCNGFDEILLHRIQEDEVVVARRYTLDLKTWKPIPRIVDYYYLSCPWTHPRSLMMQSCPWISRTEAWSDKPIDELMCFQGSMWMMSRAHWNWLGGLSEGLDFAEHHEISMKTWLGGRRVVVNKNAWYAHPSESVRGYHMSMSTVYADHEKSARYWMSQPGYADLIDHFWPLPTEHNRHRIEKYYWPEDWRTSYDAFRNSIQVQD